MTRALRTLLPALVAILLLSVVPVDAGPGEHKHEYGYGDVPGNPLVEKEAERCLAATADDPDRTCIVLYGHIFDLLSDFLANTQRPPEGTVDLARGFNTSPTIEPWFDLNELEMYSSPGFVEYREDASLGPKIIHMERGITSDVAIARDVPIFGYWHLSVDLDELYATDPELDTGVMPCVTVHMALATGRVYDPKNMIAEGRTTKTLVSSRAGADGKEEPIATTPCPGGRQGDLIHPEAVTEFEVDMGLAAKDIPKDEGFVVFVEWYAFAPGDPSQDNKVGGHGFNIHTGATAPNRVVVPIMDPVRIDELRVEPFAGKLYVQAVANSPWGSYDVDPTSLALRVYDETGALVTIQHANHPILRYDTSHIAHFEPVVITWPWDYRAEGLAPGTYTVEAYVQNWQHTGEATARREVVITPETITVMEAPPEPPEPNEAPGMAPLLLVVAAAVALARCRRP